MGNTNNLGGAEISTMPKPTAKVTKPKKVNGQPQLSYEKIARVIVLTLIGEMDIRGIAQEVVLSTKSVQRIQKAIPVEARNTFGPGENNDIQELITTQIKENLLATQRIVQVTQDEVWLKAQRAPELGTFYGIITDKTIRILDAIERANERERIEAYKERSRLESITESIATSIIKQGN